MLLNHKEGIASAYGNMGIVYLTRGDLDKAEESWTRSLELFEAIGARDRAEKVRGWIEELRAGGDEGGKVGR